MIIEYTRYRSFRQADTYLIDAPEATTGLQDVLSGYTSPAFDEYAITHGHLIREETHPADDEDLDTHAAALTGTQELLARIQIWEADRRELGRREEAGARAPWTASDETAVDLLRDAAALLNQRTH